MRLCGEIIARREPNHLTFTVRTGCNKTLFKLQTIPKLTISIVLDIPAILVTFVLA